VCDRVNSNLFIPALLEGIVRPLLHLSTPLIISRYLRLEPGPQGVNRVLVLAVLRLRALHDQTRPDEVEGREEGIVRPLLHLSTPLIISRYLRLEPSTSPVWFGLAASCRMVRRA
jgi:hypothetical protein